MNPSAGPPRIGLLGVGGFARTHLGHICALHDEGRLEFRAAVVIEPDPPDTTTRMLQERHVAVFPTFERFLEAQAGQLELCVIPTGIPSHAPLTIGALHAGMNVYVEKPLAGSMADVDAVRKSEAGAGGRFVAVGFQHMYEESTPRLKAALCAGALGRVRSIRTVGAWPRSRAYYQRNDWAGRLRVDGAPVFDSPLQNAFAHFVHLALFFGGAAFEQMASVVIGDAEVLRAHEIESFDTAVVRAHSTHGVEFWFGATHACRTRQEPRIRIEGTHGAIDWRLATEYVMTTGDGAVERRSLPSVEIAQRRTYETVLRRLRHPATFVSTTDMAAAHTALIESLHASFRIRSVPSALIDEIHTEEAAGIVPAIRGIEDALDRAFASGSTLSSTGFTL